MKVILASPGLQALWRLFASCRQPSVQCTENGDCLQVFCHWFITIFVCRYHSLKLTPLRRPSTKGSRSISVIHNFDILSHQTAKRSRPFFLLASHAQIIFQIFQFQAMLNIYAYIKPVNLHSMYVLSRDFYIWSLYLVCMNPNTFPLDVPIFPCGRRIFALQFIILVQHT